MAILWAVAVMPGGRAEFGFHASEEVALGRATMVQECCCHPEYVSGPVFDFANPLPKHFACTLVVVGAQAQPGGELITGLEPRLQVSPHLAKQGNDQTVASGDPRYVHAEWIGFLPYARRNGSPPWVFF